MKSTDGRTRQFDYLDQYTRRSSKIRPRYHTLTVHTGDKSYVYRIWPSDDGETRISVRFCHQTYSSRYRSTRRQRQRQAGPSRRSRRNDYSHRYGSSPLSKIQVTAAKRRSTVHRHKSRKRRAYLGERAGTPLEHVSQWRQSSANPGRRSDWSASVKRTKLRPQNTKTLRTAHRRRRQKRTHGTGSMRSKPYGRSSSHLLSSPTLNRPSNPLPTIVHVETPLSPSPECPALWTYPETFDKHTTPPLDRLGCLERMSARFRPSSSEISDIMPCTGPLAAPAQSFGMNGRSTSLSCPMPGLLERPTGTQYPSHSGRDLKTQSTKIGSRDRIRNTFRSLQSKFIGLRSCFGGSWVDLNRRGDTRTIKQEQVYNSAAEISMAEPLLPAFTDDEHWDSFAWKKATNRALDTVYDNNQVRPVE